MKSTRGISVDNMRGRKTLLDKLIKPPNVNEDDRVCAVNNYVIR